MYICVISVLYYIILYYIILYYIILYYIILYCIVLYCIVLYCIVLYCIVLYCIVLYYIILYYIILYYIILYYIILYYIILYYIIYYVHVGWRRIENEYYSVVLLTIKAWLTNERWGAEQCCTTQFTPASCALWRSRSPPRQYKTVVSHSHFTARKL